MSGFWDPVFGWLIKWFTIWLDALKHPVPTYVRKQFSWLGAVRTVSARDLLQGHTNHQYTGLGTRVLIGHDDALHYRFTLPEGARSELARAARLESERVLPLTFSKLITSFSIKKELGPKPCYTVAVYAVKTKLISEIERSASEAGIRLISIAAFEGDSSNGVEFPISELKRNRRVLRIFGSILIGLLVVCVIKIPGSYVDRLKSEIERTDRAISNARNATRQVATLQSQMNEKKNLSSSIANIKRGQRITYLLEQLTKASPDTVFIETLRLDGSKLALLGLAYNPENWTLELEGVDGFGNVTLISVRDMSDGTQQRFELRMDVGWQKLMEAAS